MAEIIEYILKTALGETVFKRVEVSDAVDAEGNDIRRVFVFYDTNSGLLDGQSMLDANAKLREHYRKETGHFAEISYIADKLHS